MAAPNILFQPPNTTGLGHISRLTAIALAWAARAPESRLLFAIEGGSHALLEAYGLPYVSLPRERDLALAARIGWSSADRARLSLGIAQAVLRAAQPDAIVFDCFPSRAIALAAVDRAIPIAMCVREMKDPQAYADQVWPALDAARLIIVPHASVDRCLPSSLWHKARCVGPITRPSPPHGSGVGMAMGQPHVTITGGGGSYPSCVPFFNRAMSAMARCRAQRPDLTATLVTGPLFTGWAQLRPVTGVRILPFVADMLDLFAGSALILCQGGYNTIGEVSCTGVPLICSPVETPHDSQHRRVTDLAARRGHVRLLADESEADLAAWILDMLRPTATRAAIQLPPGADAAAEALWQMCARPDQCGMPGGGHGNGQTLHG